MQRIVLVIDDDPDIRAVAKTSLELVGGFRVIVADSGQRGCSIARDNPPDVIILDLMMPDLDGRSTLAQLKGDSATAKIPVILLTAKIQADKREFMGRGAAGVLVKPFDPMQLSAQVCEILGWPTSEREHT